MEVAPNLTPSARTWKATVSSSTGPTQPYAAPIENLRYQARTFSLRQYFPQENGLPANFFPVAGNFVPGFRFDSPRFVAILPVRFLWLNLPSKT
jgi:hypothetical protein